MANTSRPTVRIIGSGRAGSSFATALHEKFEVAGPLGRDFVEHLGGPVDFTLICVTDSQISSVALALPPKAQRVVAHVAGSVGVEELGQHPRRACIHPLVSLTGGTSGARRLLGAWFAVSGDPAIESLVSALDGQAFAVSDSQRPLYHATASIAANHLVGLLGQVSRLAEILDVPQEAFFDLAQPVFANVKERGAKAALTGPLARGDWETLRSHRCALEEISQLELDCYLAGARLAAAVAEVSLPPEMAT